MKWVFSLFGRLMMGDCAASLLLDSTKGIPALISLPSIFLRHNCAITNIIFNGFLGNLVFGFNVLQDSVKFLYITLIYYGLWVKASVHYIPLDQSFPQLLDSQRSLQTELRSLRQQLRTMIVFTDFN